MGKQHMSLVERSEKQIGTAETWDAWIECPADAKIAGEDLAMALTALQPMQAGEALAMAESQLISTTNVCTRLKIQTLL